MRNFFFWYTFTLDMLSMDNKMFFWWTVDTDGLWMTKKVLVNRSHLIFRLSRSLQAGGKYSYRDDITLFPFPWLLPVGI